MGERERTQIMTRYITRDETKMFHQTYFAVACNMWASICLGVGRVMLAWKRKQFSSFVAGHDRQSPPATRKTRIENYPQEEPSLWPIT